MVFEDARKWLRWRRVIPRGLPPRGRRYSALSEAGEAPAGDCGRQSRPPNRWRALECLSQRLQSVVGAEKDVLGRPRIVAVDEAGCLGGDVCCLEQSSAASSVRSGSAHWGRWQWSTWRGFAG